MTDPRDANSRFGIAAITRDLASGDVTITVPTVPGRRYVLQASMDLRSWQQIDSFNTSPGEGFGSAEFDLSAAAANAQLRVLVGAAP